MIHENKRTWPHFARCERDLFAKIRRLLEVRPADGLELPDGELVTDFCRGRGRRLPEVQAKADANDLRNNSISILDVLARKTPTCRSASSRGSPGATGGSTKPSRLSRGEGDRLPHPRRKPAGNAPAGAGNGGTNPTNEQAPEPLAPARSLEHRNLVNAILDRQILEQAEDRSGRGSSERRRARACFEELKRSSRRRPPARSLESRPGAFIALCRALHLVELARVAPSSSPTSHPRSRPRSLRRRAPGPA